MPHSKYIVAIDIGGTNVRTYLVETNGAIIVHHRDLTPSPPSPTKVINVVDNLLRSDHRYQDASALIVGVPGLVDSEMGIVRKNSNLSWVDVPFAKLAQERWSRPVLIENDVRLHTLGELASSTAAQNMLCVVIGTGVAMGIVVNGQIYKGSHLIAGELGHLTVDTHGVLCGCGKMGCLETVCGVRGLSRLYSQCSGDIVSDFPRQLIDGLSMGNTCAVEAWRYLSESLAWALSAAIALFDPEKVIMGGGLGVFYPAWKEYFWPLLDSYLIPGTLRPQILPSALGEQAVTYGAIYLARSAGWMET